MNGSLELRGERRPGTWCERTQVRGVCDEREAATCVANENGGAN